MSVLTVRERVLRSLQHELSKIQTSNGYTMDVVEVVRTKRIPERIDNLPAIYIMPGKCIPDYRGSHYTLYNLQVFLFCMIHPEADDYDGPMNDLFGEVAKVFNQNPHNEATINDIYNGKRQIFVSEIVNDPGYDDTLIPHITGGRKEYLLQYWTIANDEKRWDWEDEEVDD